MYKIELYSVNNQLIRTEYRCQVIFLVHFLCIILSENFPNKISFFKTQFEKKMKLTSKLKKGLRNTKSILKLTYY